MPAEMKIRLIRHTGGLRYGRSRIRSRLRWSSSKSNCLMATALCPLAIRRLDGAEIFAVAADDDDAPVSRGLFGMGTLRHRRHDNAGRARRRVSGLSAREIVLRPKGHRKGGLSAQVRAIIRSGPPVLERRL